MRCDATAFPKGPAHLLKAEQLLPGAPGCQEGRGEQLRRGDSSGHDVVQQQWSQVQAGDGGRTDVGVSLPLGEGLKDRKQTAAWSLEVAHSNLNLMYGVRGPHRLGLR